MFLKIGNFNDSLLNEGIVYTIDGFFYEGLIKSLKRHGINQKEIKLNHYEFIGDFEEDKRTKGKITYFNVNSLNHIKTVEIEDFKALYRGEKTWMKLTFDYMGKKYYYQGSTNEKKLKDKNACLGSINNSGFPKFIGEVDHNMKNGKGIYYWNQEDSYQGPFVNNKMDSSVNSDFDFHKFNKLDSYIANESIGILHHNKICYNVAFNKGELVGIKEIFDSNVL